MTCEGGDGGRPCSGKGVLLVRVAMVGESWVLLVRGDPAQVRWVWLVRLVMVGDPAQVRGCGL